MKNLQRSFSIRNNISTKIYGIFMVNTWRNSCSEARKKNNTLNEASRCCMARKQIWFPRWKICGSRERMKIKKNRCTKIGEFPACHLSTRWRQPFFGKINKIRFNQIQNQKLRKDSVFSFQKGNETHFWRF